MAEQKNDAEPKYDAQEDVASLPPDGVYFRLVNKQSQFVIYSNPDGRFGGSYPAVDKKYDDQYWKAVDVDGAYFRLQNKESKKCIYANSDGRFGDYPDGYKKYDDQWFKLDDVDHDPPFFRLINKQSNRVIYSNLDGRFNTYPGIGYKKYDDQYWRFEFENYEILSVEFDYDKGQIANKKPEVIGTMVCDNEKGGAQSKKITFNVEEAVTETSSFNKTAGFSIEIGTKFKTGIPFVAEGEIETKIGASTSFEWGSEKSTTKTYSASFEVEAAAGEIVKAEATVWKANLYVPYTMKLKVKDRNVYFTSKGQYNGVTSWELRCAYKKLNE